MSLPQDAFPPLTNLPPLRPWQADCIGQALRTLSDNQPHFLCQATPGAGKMLMAAVLTRELMERDDIDYVLYLGPTLVVVERAAETLAHATGRAMHGRLGAGGATFTYHALQHRLEELKGLCQGARVLLIWDESHHAAGHVASLDGVNQWGMALLALERHVRYTIALSGTPWRTDGSCLPLLRYMEIQETAEGDVDEEEPEGAGIQARLIPDFVYSLRDAIRDRICRQPHLQLVDNRAIQLTRYHPRSGRQETHRFSSIPQLLKHPAINYASLLQHNAPLQHMLDLGCQKLTFLRQSHTDAAGLVVASDIEHAEALAEALEDRGETACLVTSRAPGAHKRLRAFRDASTSWIVSVGMVSEGVDIPRLRVCCYLSHVRTEQYFRQVLGRIIRRQGERDAECFLYAFNEPYLRRYARRIVEDLPEDLASVTLPRSPTSSPAAALSPHSSPSNGQGSSQSERAYIPPIDSRPAPGPPTEPPSPRISLDNKSSSDRIDPDVAFSRAFFERLVALRLPS